MALNGVTGRKTHANTTTRKAPGGQTDALTAKKAATAKDAQDVKGGLANPALEILDEARRADHVMGKLEQLGMAGEKGMPGEKGWEDKAGKPGSLFGLPGMENPKAKDPRSLPAGTHPAAGRLDDGVPDFPGSPEIGDHRPEGPRQDNQDSGSWWDQQMADATAKDVAISADPLLAVGTFRKVVGKIWAAITKPSKPKEDSSGGGVRGYEVDADGPGPFDPFTGGVFGAPNHAPNKPGQPKPIDNKYDTEVNTKDPGQITKEDASLKAQQKPYTDPTEDAEEDGPFVDMGNAKPEKVKGDELLDPGKNTNPMPPSQGGPGQGGSDGDPIDA